MLFAQQNAQRSGQKSGAAVTSDPLLQTAIVRGRLMEGLADALGWTTLRDRAFMVGMLSLIDAVFQQPMMDLLALINLEESLQNAIVHRSGRLGILLQLVTASESADDAATLALLPHFPGLTADQFNHLEVEALKWANQI